MADLFSHKLVSTETSSLFTDEKIANARAKVSTIQNNAFVLFLLLLYLNAHKCI